MDRLARSDILVVCTANVCRSPLAEYVLQELLRGTRGFESVAIGSVGVKPVRNGRMCELAEASLTGTNAEPFARAHKSLSATPTRLGNATLILTASRSNRAAIARILPQARPRTFTITEAIALGQGFSPEGETGVDAVRAFARYLDARRGLAAPVAPSGVRSWFSRASDPWSIADGHNLGAKQHARTISEVRSRVTTLGGILVEGARSSSAARAS
ncbi:MAG: hypothetical protein DI534_13545 [Leifsonia xyli]|nr:MAG: hypothetical protein DI534_13545 [Leifsonia xyli]